MKWDAWLDDTAGDAPLAILPESPPGKPHVGEIVKASLADKPFDWAKSAANPDGTCLVIEVSVSGYQTFEATIPCHYVTKVQALCRSARVHPPARNADWDESCLLGQTVTFESVTAMSSKGREYVRVNKWLANPSPPPPAVASEPKRPVARSQSQKASRELSPDDIPF